MKRFVLIALMTVGIVGAASAQHDDMYFVPKKKKVEQVEVKSVAKQGTAQGKTLEVTTVSANQLVMDEDAYNRRGAYLTDQGDAVSEFAVDDEGFVLITEEGDTMWMNTDTLRLARVSDGEGWVNGFDGSDSDYEYAMRIVRFRNPRYAIPVSSPLYWDVVYGGALWPSWEWNIYDDGMYAYVFPTRSNWYYWDYMVSYPFGWSTWGNSWNYYHGYHWGHHWGNHCGWHSYGHVWYDPWFNPYFPGYNPGWHHGHQHGHYPHFGAGRPGWGGGPKVMPNTRKAVGDATRREASEATGRSTSSSSRTGVASARTGTERRIDNGSSRNTSARVVTGSTVRSSASSRTDENEVVRRSSGSSSVSRGTATGNSSRGGSTARSTSRSSSSTSGSSYSRPSSTRSSSSSSTSRSSSSSSSSRSSSYSSGGSSSGSSYSSGGSSRSSYSGGGSHSGGSSRSSYSGGSSSRSSGGRR